MVALSSLLVGRRLLMLVLVAGVGGCRGCDSAPKRGRTTPVCAVQDCKTGAILDNGCSDDGKCVACVNACPPGAIASPDAR
ncbi:MAG TPA: hypothetical protein VGF45_20760 [Polyangia bacterium]